MLPPLLLAACSCALFAFAVHDPSLQPHHYNYARHGLDWPEKFANDGTNKCDGTAQSPIDLQPSTFLSSYERVNTSGIDLSMFEHYTMKGVGINLEQDMQIQIAPPAEGDKRMLPTIEIDGKQETFMPVQLHFHHFSSEHTVDGRIFPLEAHLVMSSMDSGKLAVLGILYQIDEVGDPFVTWAQHQAKEFTRSYGQEEVPIDMFINVGRDLTPSSLKYAGYDGSLTTPPCSEIVKWHVFLQPRTVSVEQLSTFAEITLKAHPEAFVTNNRVVQPLNGRSVYVYEDQPHDYDYTLHGLDWPEAFPELSCNGSAQSPINIVTQNLVEDTSSRQGVSGVNLNGFQGEVLSAAGVNLEQDMQVQIANGSGIPNLPSITIDGTSHTFEPLQLHFHHFASEHTVDGKIFPLEMHLVMVSQQDANQLAVIGVLYSYGEEDDPFLTRLFEAVAQKPAVYGKTGVPIQLDIDVGSDLLPQTSLEYAGYDGSLTTPPCSEIVKWHVFLQPRTVSVEQLSKFAEVTLAAHKNAIVTNNRIVQPLNGRTVARYVANN